MTLIKNWRDAWKWYSTWAFASIATIQTSVLVFVTPAQLAAPVLFYPTWTWEMASQAVIAFLAVTGGIGRLISQSPKSE
jgi:hypothetical protein